MRIIYVLMKLVLGRNNKEKTFLLFLPLILIFSHLLFGSVVDMRPTRNFLLTIYILGLGVSYYNLFMATSLHQFYEHH